MRRMRTINEAAAFLREADPQTAVTRTGLRRLVTSGQIPSVRIGAKYLVDLDVLDSFLAGRRCEPVSQDGAIRRLEVL